MQNKEVREETPNQLRRVLQLPPRSTRVDGTILGCLYHKATQYSILVNKGLVSTCEDSDSVVVFYQNLKGTDI